MKTVEDLIEEAKVRFVWWAICIFAICYFLSHTSKSMWMNIPVSLLIAFGLRVLMNEVDFHRKIPPIQKQTYLAYLEKKQLSVNDPRLSTVTTPPQKWKKKIDSPVIQASVQEFIDLIVRDFVVDLWYSDITPDKEAPELMRTVILDALGEVAGRVKEVNIVDLLTRDMINLVGDHIELYRRSQAAIGVDVMATLSSEERDERLKHHLMASEELHPALLSPVHEYKFLQQLMSGILALVLKQRESQCPLVHTIARELLTCLVIQPVIKLASPSSINELIEFIIINFDEVLNLNIVKNGASDLSSKVGSVVAGTVDRGPSSTGEIGGAHNKKVDLAHEKTVKWREQTAEASHDSSTDALNGESIHQSADWARVLDAATQRRTEVLAPENLENMWARGRNYKDKVNNASNKSQMKKGLTTKSSLLTSDFEKLMSLNKPDNKGIDNDVQGAQPSAHTNQSESSKAEDLQLFQNLGHESSLREGMMTKDVNNDDINAGWNKTRVKKSISSAALNVEPDKRRLSPSGSKGILISEFYSPDLGKLNPQQMHKVVSNPVIHCEMAQGPKLRCRVLGAYFEKIGSKSFAVYSIAVTDSEKNTWFVNRRYRNFERLHRHLKDIPNYNLHLPPKRIFSSSTEDSFVHQRCIQLDKYLQDLLSIANVAEQHDVWDFLNDSSKTYSYGKAAYGMRTLAVNLDDAVDDILRQLEGASDVLTCKVVGGSSASYGETSQPEPQRFMSWDVDDNKGRDSAQSSFTRTQSSSDDEEEVVKDLLERESSARAQEWHSDNELSSKELRPRIAKQMRESRSFKYDKTFTCEPISELKETSGAGTSRVMSDHVVDPDTAPPEWTPPNVCVPALNLVDKIFQLNRRGWLRRQVFWMSKQILQLVMEDAIDDFLLEQINWLRKDDVIAQGIQYLQNILWPGGKFFLNLELTPRKSLVNHHADSRVSPSGSFEAQLAAARRASDVKKLLFKGAPTALVSFVGHKQYKRCARDIYYFTQSSICIKQLAYAGMELVIISVFPEMKDVVVDIHRKMGTSPA